MSELIHKDYLNPLFLLSNMRPKYMYPDLEVKSVADIDIDRLKRRNIKGIILDVDNTLCPYHGTVIDDRVKDNFERIKKEFRTCVLSNTNDVRIKELENYFDLHVIQSKIKKPRPEAFQEALDYLGTTPSETAMIGDGLLTDIVGANRMGLYSIRVEPLRWQSDPLLVVLARAFETFMLRFYQE